jgi:hypothetical protein
MTTEWETHIEIIYEQEKDIEAGKAIETYVIDPVTFETVHCKAIISKDPSKLPDGDVLKVRNFKGQMEEKPWAIKILERRDMQVYEE